MKRMTATLLLVTAISAPALAESPTQHDMHSWGYVQQTANTALAPAEAGMMERHEQRPYYNNESGANMAKHHGKHHMDGKHHGKHHHHHHMDKKKDDMKAKDKPAQEQPKQ